MRRTRVGDDTENAAAAADAAPWQVLVRQRGRTTRLALRTGRVTIGSAPGCELQLRGAGVAGRHATLVLHEAHARLEVVAGAPAADVNGTPVRAATLHAGDALTLGAARLMLQQRPAAAVEAPRRLALAADEAAPASAPPPTALDALAPFVEWALEGFRRTPAELLAVLAGVTAARGAAVVELRPQLLPRVVSSWGVAALPESDRLWGALAVDEARARELAAAEGKAVASFGCGNGVVVALLLATAEAVDAPLLRAVTRIFAQQALRGAVAAPQPTTRAAGEGLVFPVDIVVGHSPAMQRLYRELQAARRCRLPVLVQGETGTGKEHVARVLHESARDGARPFVTINCAAIPAELLEAELFGIGRGVATGVEERTGKFQHAHGGTLVLDEVGELPFPLQAKLLRALEERTVQAVGGKSSAVDVQVVAATNADLEERARRGVFRPDLYHRLAGMVVTVPSLRERVEDIPLLFERLLATMAGGRHALAPTALAALLRYAWPGNVRELRNETARLAASLAPGAVVEAAQLSPRITAAAPTGDEDVPALDGDPRAGLLARELGRRERELVLTALAETGGNQSRAAVRLGISRERLRRRLGEWGVAARDARLAGGEATGRNAARRS